MTEIELSALESQCLGRRLETIEQVRCEAEAWAAARNAKAVAIKWQFTIEQARTKLGKAYPVPVASSAGESPPAPVGSETALLPSGAASLPATPR